VKRTEECINLADGIFVISSHSLEIKLYLSTESRASSSNPPITMIYWLSKIETAE